jgi:hypothetical protein
MSAIPSAETKLADAPDTPEVQRGRRVLGGSMALVAIRCTLQYVLLPFVLPLLGASTRLSLWLTAALEVGALALMAFNIWRLWNTAWRWRYLALCALTGSLLLLFLYLDIQALLQ